MMLTVTSHSLDHSAKQLETLSDILPLWKNTKTLNSDLALHRALSGGSILITLQLDTEAEWHPCYLPIKVTRRVRNNKTGAVNVNIHSLYIDIYHAEPNGRAGIDIKSTKLTTIPADLIETVLDMLGNLERTLTNPSYEKYIKEIDKPFFNMLKLMLSTIRNDNPMSLSLNKPVLPYV